MNNQELEFGQMLEELSLYLEISKYQTLLSTLKNEALTTITDESVIKEKEALLKQYLSTCFESLLRFGIDVTDSENFNKWIMACSTYTNNLDMVEYTLLVQQRSEGKNLNILDTSEYKESIFLKRYESEKNKEQKM